VKATNENVVTDLKFATNNLFDPDGVSQQPDSVVLINRSKIQSDLTKSLDTDMSNSLNLDIDIQQKQDADIAPILAAMMESVEPPDWNLSTRYSESTKNLLAQWPLLTVKDKVLYRKWLIAKTQEVKWLQCIIPYAAREEVMRLSHTGMTGGHYGIRKTMLQIQRRAYWKGWRRDCARFIKQCKECATYRRGKAPRQGELQDNHDSRLTNGKGWYRPYRSMAQKQQ